MALPRPGAALAGVVALIVACWVWIGSMARDMYGSMSGLSAWMMTGTWDTRHLLLLWLMWAAMMAAMMLPAAMPLLTMYEGMLRRRAGTSRPGLQVNALAAGYLLAWAIFSVGAVALQRALSSALLLNPMMEMPNGRAVGGLLALAGIYQLTPLKRMCLQTCRSPLSFVMRRWRNGLSGAVRMGVEHGVYCLGCCWALMLLLFAGGVMNLTGILALTAIVVIEKVVPMGEVVARALGSLLIAAGAWFLIR
jgi:predicted metal-binding membrane protein